MEMIAHPWWYPRYPSCFRLKRANVSGLYLNFRLHFHFDVGVDCSIPLAIAAPWIFHAALLWGVMASNWVSVSPSLALCSFWHLLMQLANIWLTAFVKQKFFPLSQCKFSPQLYVMKVWKESGAEKVFHPRRGCSVYKMTFTKLHY